MDTVSLGMQRRDILKRAGAATTVGILAGCLSRNAGSPGGSGGGTKTTTTTTTNGSTTTEGTTQTGSKDKNVQTGVSSTLQNHSLKVLSAKCGTPKNEASIAFKDSNKKIVITGEIPGSDSCARPVLKRARGNAKTGKFEVTVGTKKKEGNKMCSQCITAIKYRATLTFADSAPKSVQVTHESMGKSHAVAGADRTSSSNASN